MELGKRAGLGRVALVVYYTRCEMLFVVLGHVVDVLLTI